MKQQNEIETHPIPNGYIPGNAKTIVIGTFPPKNEYKDKTDFFFYSSVRNHFWNRMESIFPDYKLKKTATKLRDVSTEENKLDKQKFCRNKNIGFIDIFTKIKRKVNNSTKDMDLEPQENIVINGRLSNILDKNQNIVRICCTYKLAFESLLFSLDKVKLEFKTNQHTANGEECTLNYKSRKISIVLLYPATRSKQKGEIKDDQYRSLIFGETI